MHATLLITDVYDDGEHPRTIDVDVPIAPDVDPDDASGREALDEWADETLYTFTGLGRPSAKVASHWVQVLECGDRPRLRNLEFVWGI